MELADKKYKNLKLTKTWNAPSEQEEKILALGAEVAKLRKTSSKTSNPNPTPRVPRTYQKDKPEWLLKNTKPPPDKKNNARTWNERPWYWCSPETGEHREGKWRAHQPVECKGTSFLASKRKEESNPKAKKHLKLTQAMQNVLDQKNQDYQDEDEEK